MTKNQIQAEEIFDRKEYLNLRPKLRKAGRWHAETY